MMLFVLQTVSVNQMTQMAKPLPKQDYIDKGKVWTVFIGGAAGLFLLTVAAENNSSWFPAIARANQAMALARKRAEEVGSRLTMCTRLVIASIMLHELSALV